MLGLLDLRISPGILTLGVIQGMTYGILAVGLVLVYRSSRVINFAHGETGAFGAAICGLAVVRWHLPYWLALALALAVSAAIGGATEVAIVRRLRHAPTLMSLVATLGVASFLIGLSAVVNNQVSGGTSFPQPPGMPQFHVGALLVTRAYSAMLLLSPVVVAALVVFLSRSRFGLALRAVAANPERARLCGVSAAGMSTLAWAISGAVAAFAAVLIIPTRGFLTAELLGPTLLLRALVPAVIARMSSLPMALAAGVAVGVVDQVLVFSYPTGGAPEVVFLVVILGALLLQSPRTGRVVEREDWSALRPWPRLPEEVRCLPAVRHLGTGCAVAGLAAAVAVGLLGSNTTAVTMGAVVAFSLMGLSVGVLTGLGGQLSLGQFALAGVGAAASYQVTYHTGNYVAGLAVAALAAAAVSLVLGLPALRVRGLLLAVITLSFALVAKQWLLARSIALGHGVPPGRPIIGSLVLDDTKGYYLYTLVVLAGAVWLARNVWRGGIGLRLRAQRDNDDGARAFGLSTTLVKQQGFLVAGMLAGLGGAVYGHLLSQISADSFDVVTSINVVALTVVGGIGFLAGPIFGALYIVALPRFVTLDAAGVTATSLGWLLLILYFPGGLAQVIAGPRRAVIGWLARRAGLELDPSGQAVGAQTAAPAQSTITTPTAPSVPGMPSTPRAAAAAAGPVLEIAGLCKRFGGVRAVDEVEISVAAGEILGVIGPNGAGKTTLFDLVSGFSRPDAGRVVLLGHDITRLSPERRVHHGLVRSFQDPALFSTLSVTEVVALAFERAEPTRFAASLIGWQRSERRKRAAAAEVVSFMGLEPFRDKEIRELSTGTRRVTELACMLPLRPTVLLLDEPSAGVAQRETEALGDLLLRLRNQLDATLVVIEHDIPLLTRLSDRMVAMDGGRVIATGTPAEVQRDEQVVESYLGRDRRALQRSGEFAAVRPGAGDRA